MADLLSLFTWLADKFFGSRGNRTKLCLRLVSTPESELTEKAYRTKTSLSDYSIEIYNMGQKPYVIDCFSLSHKKGLLIDCFPDTEKNTIQPYEKIVYILMEQEANALEYHCKKAQLKKCTAHVYDIMGKCCATKLDVSSITFVMSMRDVDAVV